MSAVASGSLKKTMIATGSPTIPSSGTTEYQSTVIDGINSTCSIVNTMSTTTSCKPITTTLIHGQPSVHATTSANPTVSSRANSLTVNNTGSNNNNNNNDDIKIKITTTVPVTTTATTSASTSTAKKSQKLRRHKVKEFNDVISCSLCDGYLINATTIDYCLHSFCRTCIINHMEKYNYCPECKSHGKEMTLENLKSDIKLNALVYKLVPGLYQHERERQVQFYCKTNLSKSEESIVDEVASFDIQEDDYFSPAEPISLSLEYHPSLGNKCNASDVPPVRYLQCPAAVTVRHLKRFLCSKYNLDINSGKFTIDMIYEDEILPEDFSLMDIGYCYKWNRIAPMKFFYRIMRGNMINVRNVEIKDPILTESSCSNAKPIDAKLSKKPSEASNVQKTVRFKDINDSTELGNRKKDDNIKPTAMKYTVFKSKSNKNNCQNGGYNNNNNEVESKREYLRDDILDESHLNGGKGPVKVIIALKPKESGKERSYSASALVSSSSPSSLVSSSYSSSSKSPKNGSKSPEATSSKSLETNSNKSPQSVSNDFKSLRSNNMRYNDYSSPNEASTSVSSSSNKEKKHTGDGANDGSTNGKLGKDTYEKSMLPKCDIVVSIPQSQMHRTSNSSDDSFENISLASLKTANKKSPKTNDDKKIEKHQDVPKLRITVPKNLTIDNSQMKESKKKARKLSIEEPQGPLTEKVCQIEYAKIFGLKPINPIVHAEKELKVRTSPDASPMSTTSSSSSSATSTPSTFLFPQDPLAITSTSSSHKKRKKAKHSREPKDANGKRRKLHAEISEQPAEESMKLKLKITANHKSHKGDSRKSSICSISGNQNDLTKSPAVIPSPITLTPPITPTLPLIVTPPIIVPATTPQVTPVSTSQAVNGSPIKLPSSPATIMTTPKQCTEVKTTISKPTLTKSLSEDLSINSNLVQNNQKPIEKPKPLLLSKQKLTCTVPKPQIMTTIHSRISPPTQSPPVITNCLPISPLPPKKLSNIQDTKIPVSPPLPPSLFKTTPITLQTITTTSTKPMGPSTKPTIPINRPTMSPPIISQNNTRMPKCPSPKSNIQNNGSNNFAIPSPPRSTNSPKLCSITSIASNANRQAQLKRSASLDTPISSTQAKQQKMEQDRLLRKSAYGPFIMQSNANALKMMKSNTPPPFPVSTSYKPTEPTYYKSTMGPSYTHEMTKRKPIPMLLPPSSISVTKMTETFQTKPSSHSSAVTITPQQPLSAVTSYTPPMKVKKPALEIVRISSNSPSVEPQSVAPKHPKAKRPPPQQIPLIKFKRSLNQTQGSSAKVSALKSPLTQMAPSRHLPPPLISMKNILPSMGVKSGMSICSNADMTQKVFNEFLESNSKLSSIEVLDLSGKSSRSPSAEKTALENPAVSSLEATLNKLKKSITSTTTIATLTTSTKADHNKNKSAISDLQNLHLLSESATNREKIAIKSQRTLPTIPKLNEISKIRGNASVRQQNASVRNIPNPSALAFRSNNGPIPMLASITKTVTPQKSPPQKSYSASVSSLVTPQIPIIPPKIPSTLTTTVATSNTIVTTTTNGVNTTPPINTINANDTIVKGNDLSSKSLPKSNSLPAISSSISATTVSSSGTTTTTTESSKLKRNIEQVAANLNMRAAAAADKSESKTSLIAISKAPTASLMTKSTIISSADTTSTVVASSAPTSSSLGLSTTSSLSSAPTFTVSSHTTTTTPTTSFKSIPSLVAPAPTSSVSASTA